jgi:hypothetical protein
MLLIRQEKRVVVACLKNYGVGVAGSDSKSATPFMLTEIEIAEKSFMAWLGRISKLKMAGLASGQLHSSWNKRVAKAVICEMECHRRGQPLSSLNATPR